MKWISVKDKLPKDNQVVLVDTESYARDGKLMALGSQHNGFWFIQGVDGRLHFPVLQREVTHWMPLPEPPKEENMELKLKPCPFCGDKPFLRQTASGHCDGKYYAEYVVGCDNCEIAFDDESTFIIEDGVPKIEYDGYAKLIERWNTRIGEEK